MRHLDCGKLLIDRMSGEGADALPTHQPAVARQHVQSGADGDLAQSGVGNQLLLEYVRRVELAPADARFELLGELGISGHTRLKAVHRRTALFPGAGLLLTSGNCRLQFQQFGIAVLWPQRRRLAEQRLHVARLVAVVDDLVMDEGRTRD